MDDLLSEMERELEAATGGKATCFEGEVADKVVAHVTVDGEDYTETLKVH